MEIIKRDYIGVKAYFLTLTNDVQYDIFINLQARMHTGHPEEVTIRISL